jgi:hypothetical protein
MPNSWIICETSGRWAAALRATIARSTCNRANANLPSRVREVRHFYEFQTSIAEQRFTLALLEVQRHNLQDTLNFLSAYRRSDVPIVALLHESLGDNTQGDQRPPNSFQSAADVLREAGVVATVDSPRRISEIFALSQSLTTSHSQSTAARSQLSFTEWAQAALPWQDE